MSTRTIAYLKVSFAVAAWGGSFIATKVALQDVSPVTVVWVRFAMGVVMLGAAVALRKQFSLPTVKELGYFAVLGFIGITWHQWLQSTALQTSQATTTAWIVATTPVFIAVLGSLFLKERLGWAGIAGIAIAAAGVVLVVSRGDLNSLVGGRFGEVGDILVLISAPNWAIFTVLSRWGLGRHPAARMMLFVMTFGWLFTSVQFLTGPGLSEIGQFTFNGWLGVGFLGVCATGLAYIFWYDGLQAIPAARVGAFLYFEPLVTAAAAAAVLGERLTPAAMAGGGITLAGVWLVNRRKTERG